MKKYLSVIPLALLMGKFLSAARSAPSPGIH
jgi:hypothetical protein